MAADLMNGYTAYSSPQAIAAEGINAAGNPESDLITVTVTVTITVSITISWTLHH